MKIFTHRHKRNSGILLLECVVYIGGLAVVIGLAYAAYYRCAANSDGMRRNASDIAKVLQCGEIWREDVRRAIGPVTVSDANASQTMRIPQKSGAVIYSLENGIIKRSRDGKSWNPFLSNVKTSQIKNEARNHVVAWRWEVELTSRKDAKVRPLFTFHAVPEKK